MPLNIALDGVLMTHPCPYCGVVTTRPGRWFRVIRHYRCKGCNEPVHLPYEQKLKLFAAAEKKLRITLPQ